jgi:hypothetical protein
VSSSQSNDSERSVVLIHFRRPRHRRHYGYQPRIAFRLLLLLPCHKMHNEGSEEESRVHYASALHPKHSQQPIVRRRHSGSVTKSNSSHSISSSRHGRSRTDSNGRRSNGGTHHPLTLTRNGSLDSAGVTRPHLSRTINRTDNSFRDDTESGDDEISSRKEEEAEVIIHQVCPVSKDSGAVADSVLIYVLHSGYANRLSCWSFSQVWNQLGRSSEGKSLVGQ